MAFEPTQEEIERSRNALVKALSEPWFVEKYGEVWARGVAETEDALIAQALREARRDTRLLQVMSEDQLAEFVEKTHAEVMRAEERLNRGAVDPAVDRTAGHSCVFNRLRGRAVQQCSYQISCAQPIAALDVPALKETSHDRQTPH
jgi:hypothetical protein